MSDGSATLAPPAVPAAQVRIVFSGLLLVLLLAALDSTIVATSGATLFRLIGGSLGTAVLGWALTLLLPERPLRGRAPLAPAMD